VLAALANGSVQRKRQDLVHHHYEIGG
jgi:hypothetical protein